MEYRISDMSICNMLLNDNDEFIVLDEEPEAGVYYCFFSEGSYKFYRYEGWIKSIGKYRGLNIIRREPEIMGICSGEMRIFSERILQVRESASFDVIREKFSVLSDKQIKSAVADVIKSMKLSDKMEKISLKLMLGDSICEMLRLSFCTYEEIKEAIQLLMRKLKYFCNSEYEKEFLYERVYSLQDSDLILVHDNDSFCKHKEIDKELYAEIQKKILFNQKVMDYEQAEKLDELLNKKYAQLSDDDKKYICEKGSEIVNDYYRRELELYDVMAKELISIDVRHSYELKVYCSENSLDYCKLYEGYLRNKIRPSHSISRRLSSYLKEF